MTQTIKPVSSKALADVIVRGLQERKGKDIKVLDLKNIGNSVCDYFVVCHGTSSTHAESLSRSVEDEVRKVLNEKPFHKEGVGNAEWILLDYFNVVVHIFQESTREFYNLEELWADATITSFDEDY